MKVRGQALYCNYVAATLFLFWDLRRLAPSLSSQIQLRPSAKRWCLPPKSPTFVRALWQIPLKRRVGPNEASALPTCHLFVSRHGLPIATSTPFAASPNRTPSPCLTAHQEEEEAGEMKNKETQKNSKQKSEKNRKSEKKSKKTSRTES